MHDALLYGVIGVTMVIWLLPAVGVFIQIGREATRAEWLEAVPGMGLLFCLSIMPLTLDWALLGVMFFTLLLTKR